MRPIRYLTFVLVICIAAPWLRARLNTGTTSSPSAARARPAAPNVSRAPVKAIMTDGESGELVPDTDLGFTTIDVPGAEYTIVYGINIAGDMVGIYGDTFLSPPRAFLLSGGKFTFFDYPGASGTLAYGINDSGVIVGYAEFQNDTVELGFGYDGTTFTPIQDHNNSATVCLGINNADWVVGGDGTVDATKGFELRNGRFGTINFPGIYVYGYATAINNLGEVVGYTIDGLYMYAYCYGKGKFQNIDYPGATETEAWGINDSGVIVGWYAGMGAYDYGFVLRKGKYISFGYPGAIITAAYRINSSGEIVGEYTLDYNTYHGFVTSPLTFADFPPDESFGEQA